MNKLVNILLFLTIASITIGVGPAYAQDLLPAASDATEVIHLSLMIALASTLVIAFFAYLLKRLHHI